MDKPTTAITRARAAYWNSRPVGPLNLGGFDLSDDGLVRGHVTNFPECVTAVGDMTQWTGEQAELAEAWATKIDATVDGVYYSARYYALASAEAEIAAQDWASKTSGPVASGEFSAKEYALGSQAATGGSAKNWAQQAGGVTGAGAGAFSAKDWATKSGASVDGTYFSARYYALAAGTSADNAANSASAAQGFAAGLSLPAITVADAGKGLVVKGDGSGYQVGIVPLPAASNVETAAGALTTKAVTPASAVATFLKLAGGVMAGLLNMAGNIIKGAKLQDARFPYLDKGTVSGTVTVDWSAAAQQRLQLGGVTTLTFSGLQANDGQGVELIIVNGAAYTFTLPTINFVKLDGTTQTTPTRALASSGTDRWWVWRENGTTMGKVI